MTPQAQQLYEHMQTHGSVTQMQAYDLYGIFRTASRMFELRKAGIPVIKTMKKGRNRYGVEVHYAEYRLGEEA